MKRVGLNGNYATAYAVKMADVDVVAAYPITPQTAIVEKLSEFVANGELDAEYINVESEHSAISACVGASLTGARVFTATSAQGLAYMHEVLFMASALRTPIVMANVNRALSAPLNIWNDHSDAMAERDSGWIQLWATNAQEAFDVTVEAFRIAEDESVQLPVMVNFDGYLVSHTYEPVMLPDDKEVKDYIPSRPMANRLSPKLAYSTGVVGPPEYYYEMKYQAIDAMERSRQRIREIDAEFNSRFGKNYGCIQTYLMDDADYAMIIMGSLTGTAKVVADALRARGEKAGVVSVRWFRPFPGEELSKALKGIKGVGVVDRAVTPGGPSSPLFTDVASALYQTGERPVLQGFVAGLGGRDVSTAEFEMMFRTIKEAMNECRARPSIYVGLRG